MDGKHVVLGTGGIYITIGVFVLAWSAQRGLKNLPHFQGLGHSAFGSVLQTVAFWPIAVVANLRHGSGDDAIQGAPVPK